MYAKVINKYTHTFVPYEQVPITKIHALLYNHTTGSILLPIPTQIISAFYIILYEVCIIKSILTFTLTEISPRYTQYTHETRKNAFYGILFEIEYKVLVAVPRTAYPPQPTPTHKLTRSRISTTNKVQVVPLTICIFIYAFPLLKIKNKIQVSVSEDLYFLDTFYKLSKIFKTYVLNFKRTVVLKETKEVGLVVKNSD